jgi:hypothetical protein
MPKPKLTLNKKPKRYRGKTITVTTKTQEIGFAYDPKRDLAGKAMRDIVVDQLQRAQGTPKPATLRRRKTSSKRWLYDTGELIRGLVASLAGNEWVTTAPPTRLQVQRTADAVAKAISLRRLLASPKWGAAARATWKAMWDVKRLR